jgi:hypothetical protein
MLPSMVGCRTTLPGQHITSAGNLRYEVHNYLVGKGWGAAREESCSPREILGHVA